MAGKTDKKVNISEIENRLKHGNRLVFYPNEKRPKQMPVTADPAEEVQTKKKKKLHSSDLEPFVPGVHTMRFRIWVSFIIMTVVMLAITWIVGMFFFPAGFSSLQKVGLEGLGNDIFAEFIESESDDTSLKSKLEQISSERSCSIFIFSLEPGGRTYSSTRGTGLEATGLSASVKEWFISAVEQENKAYTFDSFSEPLIKSDSMVVYGEKRDVDGTLYYVYISCALPSFDLSGFSITTVLLILTAVLIASGIVIAYLVSGYASKPIKELSTEVTELDEQGERKPLKPSGFTEVDDLKHAFNKAIDAVESNNRFRRDLLANVSHDMKTPLTMIQAYAEMIRDITAGNKEKTSQNANTIIAETTRLNALINEVMDLSKLEAGVVELERCSFDYTEKVDEVISRFVGLSDIKGYKISAEVEKGLFVDGDPDTIDRVLYNLIGNAINYTGDDKKVHVICKRVGDSVETHVLDTGKGIDKESMHAVWDKYYRLVQDKRRIMGSGLGLSIVKTVLDLHCVEYGVISEVGKGSDFYFCLPAVQVARPRVSQSRTPLTK